MTARFELNKSTYGDKPLPEGREFMAVGYPIGNTNSKLITAMNLGMSLRVKERLHTELRGVEILIKNEMQYNLMLNVLTSIHCPIWPWHGGYKEPNENDDFGRYVWMEDGIAPGLMKALYCCGMDSEARPNQKTIAEVVGIIATIMAEEE